MIFEYIIVIFELFWPILIQSCHFMGWKWKQIYSRDETDVIAQSGGQDFAAKSIFSISQTHMFTGKLKIETVLRKLIFYNGFMVNSLGQNVHNDCGIISGFHKNHNFAMHFTDQGLDFPQNLDFQFRCLNALFFFRGQIWEAFSLLEYKI